ncbi:FMN-binding protein [Sesbania bispinosa]|nr:FMN-binding protein [Sesbania bispinosa]
MWDNKIYVDEKKKIYAKRRGSDCVKSKNPRTVNGKRMRRSEGGEDSNFEEEKKEKVKEE